MPPFENRNIPNAINRNVNRDDERLEQQQSEINAEYDKTLRSFATYLWEILWWFSWIVIVCSFFCRCSLVTTLSDFQRRMTELEQYLSAHDKLILNCLISFLHFLKMHS